MLQVKNLTITHKKDLRVLLDGFSFVLNHGDKAVIIGEEGNGKSTLLKWIYNPEMVSDYIDANGERIIDKERLGYLPQELPRDQEGMTVYEYFTQDEVFWDKNPKELHELTGKLSLPADFFYGNQLMGSLSGGEKIKAQLLKVMIQEPTVLLLDEPSNDIDIETLEWLEKFISDSSEAILFVSHDEVLIENTANVIVHIEQLRRKTQSRYSVMRMTYDEYVRFRDANMRNQEALAISQRREQKIKDEKIRKIEQSVEHAQATISRKDPHGGKLLKKKMHAVKSMEKRYEREKDEMAEVPEAESAMNIKIGDADSAVPSGKTVIDFSLDRLLCPDGSRELSRDIRLFLRGSEKVCILGKNGVGKSTLIKMIADEMLSRKDLHAEYMPQNYEDLLIGDLTPVSFLSKTGEKEEVTKIRTYLGSMKFTTEEMDHKLSDLSGGQRAKIFLLKMSLSDANVLILDEPTRNFSPLSGPVIRRVLKDFPGAIISISHDRKYIDEVCEKKYLLTEKGLEKIG